MRVSMVMIARDEQHNVAPCLRSCWQHVDEIVFVDTGSADGTLAELHSFAARAPSGTDLVTGTFRWCDDFAAARAHAHSLATGDVHCRIDLDDRLIGGEHLRGVADSFEHDPELVMVNALWSGPITPAQWRGQIFRAGHEWRGRTYEYPHFDTGTVGATSLVRWQHTRRTPRGRRDLDIALAWAVDEPDDWRPLNAAAEEAFILGCWELADACCEKALKLNMPDGTRAYFLQLQARSKLERGDPTAARATARQALKALRAAGDTGTDFLGIETKTWTTLAVCELRLRDAEILRCARRAMDAATTEEGRQAVIDIVSRENRAPRLPHAQPSAPPIAGTATSRASVQWNTAR